MALAVVGVSLMAAGGPAMARDGAVAGIPGFTLFAAGYVGMMMSLVLFGIAALRTRMLPRWASFLIILTPVLLFLFNTEDARA